MSATMAFLVRSIGTGLFVGNAILLAATAKGEIDNKTILLAVLTGIQGALTYAGIGAAIPQIEPKIGNKITDK